MFTAMFRNHKLLISAIAITIVTLLLSVASVRAESPDKYTKPHEPFTAYGMQVRMSVIDPIDKSWQKTYQPTVFQEIAPCRLTSTLNADHYDTRWGGPVYQPNEARHYAARGVLTTATFVDPCSEAIPSNAIGIVGRFTVTPGNGDGEIHIDPANASSSNATTVLKFRKDQALMFEAGVMFSSDGTFDVATWNAGADVTIDVLGFLLPDPAPTSGAKGDKGDSGAKGDRGDTGAKGETGATGAKGNTGDTGANGAKGDKGDHGDKGDTGLRGEIGPQGPIGANGPKGDRGENGLQGPAGATGPKGDRGESGLQGVKGDRGENGLQGAKGERGENGLQGAKGDRGENGLQGPAGAAGPKGDHGENGLQGPAGARGATGPAGSNGPAGPAGPMGPAGPAGHDGHDGSCSSCNSCGLTVVKGTACYPPGNNSSCQFVVRDGSVTSGSIVILNYTDAGSNGNALSITSQGAGYFYTTGSPNRCFQYVVLNKTP